MALEEVVVTAQKREQNLQDVPISVTAISTEEMNSLTLVSSRDLGNHIPGLIVGGANNGRPEYFIRGVGVEDFQAGTGNAVALYRDGVLLGSSFGASTQLFDMAQVEILRGPQGTLWGKNTTGGLINFISKLPEVGGEMSGYGSITVAQYGDFIFEGAVGFPINDTMAGRVSIKHNQSDGKFDYVGPEAQGDGGGGDWNALRAQLAWEPNEQLSALVAFTYGDLDGEMRPQKSIGTAPPAGQTSCSNPGRLGTDCQNWGFTATDDPHESSGFRGLEEIKNRALSLTVTYDFENITLTSISAFEKAERLANQDTDGSPTQLLQSTFDDDFEGFTQELKFASTGDGSLQWQAGFWYQTSDLDYFRSNYIGVFGGTSRAISQNIETDTWGVFGEVTYNFTDRLTGIAGYRYTQDEREGDLLSSNLAAPIPGFNGTPLDKDLRESLPSAITGNISGRGDDWTEPSWKLSLSYSLTDEINTYVTVSEGFRGGDFNAGATDDASFQVTDPEFLTSYEIGLKAQFESVRLNLSAYKYDYEDKILLAELDPPPGSTAGTTLLLFNAAELDIQGIDFELDWQVTEQLRVDLGAAYIDAEFDAPGDLRVGFAGESIDGNMPANTPEFSWDAIVTYAVETKNGGTWNFQYDVTWKDDLFFTNLNEFGSREDSYALHGLSIGYQAPEENWDVRVWVKNLDDEEYQIEGFNFIGPFLNAYGEPRQIGATATFRF